MDVLVESLEGKKVGVAVSGGMDSMALLHWFINKRQRLNISLVAINFDHGLRKTSRDDSLFVTDYCQKNNIPCLFYKLDLPKNQNIENAARKARYNIFYELLKKDLDIIATAHHAQDNAETVLLHLFRGCGLKGAGGIRYKTPEGIIRPLLYTPKEDIERYVKENNIPYVTDETNLKTDYDRNYIRLEVLPKILQRFPFAVKNITEFAKTAKTDDDFISGFVKELEQKDGEVYLPLEEFERPASVINRTILKALNILGVSVDLEQKHIELIKSLKDKQTGSRLDIKNQVIAIKDYNRITLTRLSQEKFQNFSAPFEVGDIRLPTGLLKVSIEQKIDTNFVKKSKDLYIDADKMPKDCVIRYRREGDTINKFGGGGKATLKEYFIDKKIPSRKRGFIPVVAKDNNIYAILGLTISEDVKITSESKAIYKLTYLEDHNG
ncbi:MAG TPA: tRNA lysidine(34) synthetase TilS [Clostridia bacterium]|jgi:tRNA(Ile)-lysidine synthase